MMKIRNHEAAFLAIPRELRENICEYVLTFQTALYKLPFRDEIATNYTQAVSKISSRLQKVNILLLTVNKQIYFEALPILQKANNFHIHRFDQLRSAVYGSESGLSDQFRHLTLHGDNRLKATFEHLLINISDWENLRYLSLAASDFHNMFSGKAMKKTAAGLAGDTQSSIRLVAKIRDGIHNIGQLFAQLLSYNDGCLRIQGQVFSDTFQVYGKKGRVTGQNVHEFITTLQPECNRAAKSGKCFHAPLEVTIGDVKVSIGYTMTGITTVRLL
jgi:hypothetical protein